MSTQIANIYQEVDFYQGKERFDSLVKHYHTLTWSKMIHCPCRKGLTSQPMSDCINCKGTGFLWIDPTEIQGVLMTLTLRKNFVNWTEELMGTAYFTTVAENKVGWMDRLVVLDGISKYSEVLQSKVENVATVPKKVFNLKFRPLSFENVFEFVDFETPYNILVLGTDFQRHPTDESKIYCDNTSGRFDRISVLYSYNTTYAVIDTLNDWRNFKSSGRLVGDETLGTKMQDTIEEYPIKVMLKKFHLIEDL